MGKRISEHGNVGTIRVTTEPMWTPVIPILWDEDTAPSPNRYLAGASAISRQHPTDTDVATEAYAEGALRPVSDDIPVQTQCACGKKPRCAGPCQYPDA